MNKFIYKTLLFSIIIMLVFGVWLYQMPMERSNYMYEQNLKDSLLRHTPSPRIIFASGSSMAFGLDSHRIQDSLKVNVVNDGLHVGAGLKFVLDGVKENVRAGDVIVIALEYEQLYTYMYGDVVTLSPQLYYLGYRRLASLNLTQWKNVLSGIHTTIRINMESRKYKDQMPYTVEGYNDRGDEVAHWTAKNDQGLHESKRKDRLPLNEDYCSCLLRQINEIEQKGGVVIITPPPLAASYGDNYMIAETDSFLRRNNRPFNVPPREHILPDSMFFDSAYHLAKNGVDVFTGKIIEEIRNDSNVVKIHHNSR